MSLRGTPVVEHAALAGGGTVTVWVGVPDDPYYDDKSQLTTVDVQLREGAAVVASVSTVLAPEQTSEALQLAREVKAALEAGEIGLFAHDLEPFADRLR
jgi:ketol-acid reductoisomerase